MTGQDAPGFGSIVLPELLETLRDCELAERCEATMVNGELPWEVRAGALATYIEQRQACVVMRNRIVHALVSLGYSAHEIVAFLRYRIPPDDLAERIRAQRRDHGQIVPEP